MNGPAIVRETRVAPMIAFSGHLALRADARADGRTVLASQSFRAPYHISKPYWDGRVLTVQVVNPTAGILAGDTLTSSIDVSAGAALLVTTPSASRIFRMRDGHATSRQHFTVAANAWLEVLPEPLVPHRGCDFNQFTRLEAERGGAMFFADLLLPGRVAHGETWAWKNLCLEVEARVAGELVFRERINQIGEQLRALAGLAGMGESACFGNAVLLAEDQAGAENWRDAVRALQADDLWIGVSALRRGGWTIKWIARDSIKLRETLRAIRQVLVATWPHLACDPRKL